MTPLWIPLKTRGLLEIQGPDYKTFLQGLVTQDVRRASPAQALYGAYLTPQGRYLHDFFILERNNTFYLELEKSALPDLMARLQRHKLRAKIVLQDLSDQIVVWACIGENALAENTFTAHPGISRCDPQAIFFVDPRTPALGLRIIRWGAYTPPGPIGTPEQYNDWRLKLGIVDGQQDLKPGKSVLLENGFGVLNALDWEKGCYLGQEFNTRIYHQGLVRKKLTPILWEKGTPPPAWDTLLHYHHPDGTCHEAGRMRSGQGHRGLALLRIAYLEQFFAHGGLWYAQDVAVEPQRP